MKKNFFNLFVFSAVFAVIIFGLGFYVGKNQVICRACPPEAVDFSLFWDAYYKLREKFVDKEKFDDKKLIYGAISGMVKSLEDPYTTFFNPEDTKKFMEDVKGSFEGVGMEVGIRKNQLQVISPIEGTPAQKSGLRPGDKILKIGDTLTVDLTIDEAVNLIRGPKGAEVILTIFRDDWESPREIKITREVIRVPSLKLEMINGNIAYLKIYQFSEKAGLDFEKEAVNILNSPARKIILDLRNNPGGYLEISQSIAGWFLERNQIVVIEDFGNAGKERKEYKSQGPSRFLDYQIVVLINQGSASASEILAGALSENRGALLVGEKSFGKGSVQELEEMVGGSSLKITVAKWLTPKGRIIADIGLEPNIKVEMTEEDYEKGIDPQLNKAIETIKQMR